MENIEYKIYKYELSPVQVPNSIVVGFLITDHSCNKYVNFESVLLLSETNGMTEEEVCQLAFNRLKPQIDATVENFKVSNNSVIGKVFLPSN